MIIKVCSTADLNLDVEPVSIATDFSKLTKKAASERFKNIKVAKHQTPIHLISHGAIENTGFNRNGDGFPEEDCEKYHHTFVEAGRAVHHNHKNKPNDPKYGDIYGSDYNKVMKRVELLIGVDNNNTKNASMLEDLHNGKQVQFSMACSVPGDYCTVCNHFAKDSKSRCKHIPKELGHITKEGKVVGMVNKKPRWFEISKVGRGADRIAFSINKKAAALDKSALDMYEENLLVTKDIYVPASMSISKFASAKRDLVAKIARMEKRVGAIAEGKVENSRDKYIKNEASKLNSAPSLSKATIEELKKFDTKQLFKALADKGIVLSPDEFFNYATDGKVDSNHLDGMKSHLPSIYQGMHDEGEELNNDEFEPESRGAIPSSLLSLLKDLVGDHSLAGPHAAHRIMRITIVSRPKIDLKKESTDKSQNSFDKALAIKYASYKLAALNYLDENDKLDEELMINALVQNRK